MRFKDIDFCKFRIPEKGGRVIWEITNECNYACSYCIFASTGKKPDNELSFSKICETIKVLKARGFNYIKFTGGEPFIRSDMLQILQFTQEQGISFDISTNASFITDGLAYELSQLKMDMIHVSIDGFDQHSHEKVRGKKTYEPTIEGLKHLKNHNLKVRVGSVIHKYNENNLEQMMSFCQELNVDELTFSLMEPVGRMRNKKTNITTKSPMILASELNGLVAVSKGKSKMKVTHNLKSHQEQSVSQEVCPAGTQFLFINSTGDVSPCTWITERASQFVLGSLYNNSLEQLMKNENFIVFREQVETLHGKCPASEVEAVKIKEIKFSQKSKVYSFATENLAYLNNVNLKDKSVLTIGASLDQCILSYLNGAKRVVNFDVNRNAKYYAELKWNALKVLSYKDFINFFMRGNSAFSNHSYQKIKPDLTTNCDLFFQSLYHSYKTGNFIREGHIFNNTFDVWNNKVNNSIYLKSETSFNKAKNSISDKRFIWIESDIQDFESIEKFDFIMLSNVADYSHKMFLHDTHQESFKTKVVEKYLNMLNNKGSIMFAYIFDYENKNKSDVRNILNNKEFRENLYRIDNTKYKEVVIPSAIDTTPVDCACFLEKL